MPKSVEDLYQQVPYMVPMSTKIKHSCYKFLSTAFICGVIYASAINPGIKTIVGHAYNHYNPRPVGIQVIPKSTPQPPVQTLEEKLTTIVQEAVDKAMQNYKQPVYTEVIPHRTEYELIVPTPIKPTRKYEEIALTEEEALEDQLADGSDIIKCFGDPPKKKKGFFSKLFNRKETEERR